MTMARGTAAAPVTALKQRLLAFLTERHPFAVTLAAEAGLASYLATQYAVEVDPVETLRSE